MKFAVLQILASLLFSPSSATARSATPPICVTQDPHSCTAVYTCNPLTCTLYIYNYLCVELARALNPVNGTVVPIPALAHNVIVDKASELLNMTQPDIVYGLRYKGERYGKWWTGESEYMAWCPRVENMREDEKCVFARNAFRCL
jgi:hypothetical protein